MAGDVELFDKMTLAQSTVVENFAEKRDEKLFEVVGGVPLAKRMSVDSQWIAFNIAKKIDTSAEKPRRTGWCSTEWYID